MYQVPNNFSFRVQDDEQRNILNALADELQTDKKFENAREFTFAIVSAYRNLQDECKQLKSKNIQIEDKLNSNVNTDANTLEFKHEDDAFTPNADVNTGEFKPADDKGTEFDSFAHMHEFIEENREDSITGRNKLIEAIGYEEWPTDKQLFSDLYEIITMPTADVEPKEVIKEVERSLSKNEILIECTDNQIELLDKISRLRVAKKDDLERLPLPKLIKKMVFNRGTLLNWGGEFNTHIPSSRIKNI